MSTERHVLVTAGPTREAIDPVRFLSNESSGRMGFAIAEAAVKAGHRATLIAGPVDLPTPKGVERVDVVSARDMLAALEDHFPSADALYMAAAVADYRPAQRHAGKWKVKESGADSVSLELVRQTASQGRRLDRAERPQRVGRRPHDGHDLGRGRLTPALRGPHQSAGRRVADRVARHVAPRQAGAWNLVHGYPRRGPRAAVTGQRRFKD